MKQFVVKMVGRTYKPFLVRYLSVTRTYVYRGIRLTVPPQVFHPGFFFSTKLLLRFLRGQNLRDRSLLELGAGSGLISMIASRDGARVTASDINPVAVEYLERNKKANGIAMTVIESDLFDRIPSQTFDRIVINPPYYRKTPRTQADFAWFCGEHGEFFRKLFDQLGAYVHDGSIVWMILCDGADIDMIRELAAARGWMLEVIFTKRNLVERNFIFRVEKRIGPNVEGSTGEGGGEASFKDETPFIE